MLKTSLALGWLVVTMTPAAAQSPPVPPTTTCDALTALPLADLLERERLANYDLRQRSGSPDFWRELGCLRAAIHATGAKGRDGALMISGTTWRQGAINAYLQALRVDSADALTHTKLGQLILDDWYADSLGAVGRAILRGATAGAADAQALRACTVAAYWAKDRATVKGCALHGLAKGSDSSSYYLALARVAAAEEDTAGTTTAFDLAVRTTSGAADRDAVRWHLQWFLSPGEQAAIDLAEGTQFVHRIRDAIARRDVRDGRAPGARLVEHFHRLEYAESRFAMQRPKAERERLRSLPATVIFPDSISDRLRELRIRYQKDSDPYSFNTKRPPHEVPALPWREYVRWQVDLDDRGIVYLRYGAPAERIPRVGLFTARELWLYWIDGERLLVHFESEAFTGSVEATRLVTGVLGDYMCDVDARRCKETAEASAGRLKPENLATLKFQDREFMAAATTKDNNAAQPAKQVRILAGAFALWRPRDRARVTVLPYAIRLSDLATLAGDSLLAPMEISASTWDGVGGVRHDSSLTRRLRKPSRAGSDAYVTGTITLPGTPGLSAWSLVVSQGADRGGRYFDEQHSPLSTGPLVLSDIVLGAASQKLSWRDGEFVLPLAPLQGFARDEPVGLYVQVLSSGARPDGVAVDVTIAEPATRTRPRKVALTVGLRREVAAGLNEIQQELDVSRLDAGTYELEIVVRHAATGATDSRRARLILR